MIIPNTRLKHTANNFKMSKCGNNILKIDTVHYLRFHLLSDLNSKTNIDYVTK